MKFSEVVKRVIELGNVIHAYWETELPKRHPRYPIVDPAVPDPSPPPEEEELRQFLRSRPPEEVYKLRALADVGSGIPATDFDTRWRRFMKDDPDTAWQIEFLLARSPSAETLEGGLAALAAQKIDLDASQLTPV